LDHGHLLLLRLHVEQLPFAEVCELIIILIGHVGILLSCLGKRWA
jgi:hypothetical protein